VKPVRVLFSVQRAGFLKNFDPVVRMLAERGHDVRIAIAQPNAVVPGQDDLLDELTALPEVTIESMAPLANEHLRDVAGGLRGVLDYFTFLDPRYPGSYRRTWEPRTARPARLLGRTPLGRSRLGRGVLSRVLTTAEASLPPSRELLRFLTEREPDVVLLTPHGLPGSMQPDLLRAAKALGIPGVVCIHSWDNLTSKARIRLQPDRVFVWNEIQRREATELHGVPGERVVVTGAQAFDPWFDWQPRPREEFCARVGLDPDRPFVLYACSAPWLGRIETDFLAPWIEAIRGADEPLRSAGILIRPHPKRSEALPTGLPNVVVWPPGPQLPAARATRADYFDSLYHCAALVGVNTSAMIEAAILRKPVLTLSLAQFADEQEHTLHFGYLDRASGGLLTTALGLDEHVDQLADALVDPEPAAQRADAFTRVFVRPYGLDVPATPRFVDEIERVAARRPAPVRPGLRHWPVRAVLLGGTGAYLGTRALWRAAKTGVRPTRRWRAAEPPPPAPASSRRP
jgi:hypothetical protein